VKPASITVLVRGIARPVIALLLMRDPGVVVG
jgi:hypothetical protein